MNQIIAAANKNLLDYVKPYNGISNNYLIITSK